MKDHYPAKKRRLTLSSKTPTRVTPNGSRPLYSQIESPKVNEITLPKKKHRSSPASTGGNRSTDESTVEIHWDNNSSQIQSKPKRGRGKRRKETNLSSLIKQIPKTRKSVESCTAEETNFSTWMQQNLAPSCTRKQNYSLRHNSSRLSCSRGMKIEALDFSEKIKKFLQEEVPSAPQPSVNRESPISLRSSPCLLQAQPKTHSPSYFSNSSADSLLNFDNLEDSLLAGIDSTAAPSKTPIRNPRNIPTRKTPLRSCRSRSSTPVLTRSARKQTTRPMPNLYTVDEQKDSGISTGSKNQPSDKCSNAESESNKIDTNNNNNQCINKKDKRQSPLIGIDFDDNDEIDQILSTQPDILLKDPINTNLSKAFDKVVKTEPDTNAPNNNKSKLKLRKRTTPTQTNKPKTITTTPDLLDNDFDGFDELLATFDMGDAAEIKCKSQEITPARRLTESQRKLKTKCHTSPLPLNNLQKKIIDQNTAFIPISKPSGSASTSTNKLDTDMQTLSIKSPVVCKKTGFNVTRSTKNVPTKTGPQNGSFVRKNMVTTACRKPFVPPKVSVFSSTLSNSMAQTMALELSAIEGKMPGSDLMEASTTVAPGITSKAFDCFSSTQKCTMEEIEQKRKFAQMKLRERLSRKRK